MTKLLDNYVQSFDRMAFCWTKRSHATDFAVYLAGELGINPKGVQVEKDGTNYRVYIPLVAAYWQPDDNHAETWAKHYRALEHKVRKWASA